MIISVFERMDNWKKETILVNLFHNVFKALALPFRIIKTEWDQVLMALTHYSCNTLFAHKILSLYNLMVVFRFKGHFNTKVISWLSVRGKNTPERNLVSTESQTHNHQIMSPTRSPLSHLGWPLYNLKQLQMTNKIQNMK